jgi:hypothetical protein
MSSRRSPSARMISGSSSSRNSTLAFLTLALLSSVAYTNFYLPIFSEDSEKRRQVVKDSGNIERTQLSAGSTWLNMAKIRDS